jgi:FkbM family methyltransferase
MSSNRTLKSRLLSLGLRGIENSLRLLGKDLYWHLWPRIAEEMSLVYADDRRSGGLKFYCNTAVATKRAQTAISKEPETLEWIDGFDRGDVLWDIGANVGVYSMYTAAKKGATVVAFEPSPFNFALLCRNVYLNGLDKLVHPFPIALGQKLGLDTLYMSEHGLGGGGAGNSFGTEIDNHGDVYEVPFRQTMIGFSVDDFVRLLNPPFPNHIKVDIDGNQEEVAKGMLETLKDPRVKTLMFELVPARPEMSARIMGMILDCGLRLERQGKVTPTNHFFVR